MEKLFLLLPINSEQVLLQAKIKNHKSSTSYNKIDSKHHYNLPSLLFFFSFDKGDWDMIKANDMLKLEFSHVNIQKLFLIFVDDFSWIS